MNIQKVIRRRIRHHGDGIDVVGDVNAAIAANVGEGGPSESHVSSKQRIVQRSGDVKRAKGGNDDDRARASS